MAEVNIFPDPPGVDPRLSITGQGAFDPFMQAMNETLQGFQVGDRLLSDDTVRATKFGEAPVLFQEANVIPSPTTQAKADPFKLFQSQLDLINKETDLGKKQQLMVGVEASFADHFAKKTEETRKLAEEQLGIKQLQDQLKQNELLDRQDPKWKQFQADSKITAGVREQYQQALSRVDGHTQKLLRENPELARLAKTIDGTLQLQRALVLKQETSAIQAMEKGDQQKLKASAIVSGVPADVRASFNKMNPTLSDDVEFVNYLSTNSKGKVGEELRQIMQGDIRPQEYLREGLTGNDMALNLAYIEQADRTKMDPRVVQAQLLKARDFVDNPRIFAEESARLGLLSKKDIDKHISDITAAQGAKDKDMLASTARARAALADKYLGAITQESLLGDVTLWKREEGKPALDMLPNAKPILDSLRSSLGRNPTADEFMTSYIKQPNLSPVDRAQRLAEVGEMLRVNLDNIYASGLYGQSGIDAVGAVRGVSARAAASLLPPRTSIGQAVGDMTRRILPSSESLQGLKQGLPPNLTLGAANVAADTVREFFRSVRGGE